MEPPAGEKDMGGWTQKVYTAEQQERLGVDEEGKKKPAKVILLYTAHCTSRQHT